MADLKVLSYSQLATYSGCPQKWWLQRRARVPDTDWYATVLGRAFHEVTETIDRLQHAGLGMADEDAVALIGPAFEHELEKALANGPVRASGKENKAKMSEYGGPNKKDADWCRHYGPLYVQRFLDWQRSNALQLVSIEGQPAIEVPFQIDMVDPDGVAIPVRGFIDRVYRARPGRRLMVVDLKTGKLPATPLQLATYGVALDVQYGLKAHYGAFWGVIGEVGKFTDKIDLPNWDAETLSTIYHAARRGIEQDVFPPNITDMCKGCTVRDYCIGWSGVKGREKVEQHLIDHPPAPAADTPGSADDETEDDAA